MRMIHAYTILLSHALGVLRRATRRTLLRSLQPLPVATIRALRLAVVPILLVALCCTLLRQPGLICHAGCIIHLACGALPPARFCAVTRHALCICRGLMGTLHPGVRAPVHVRIVFMRSSVSRRRLGNVC